MAKRVAEYDAQWEARQEERQAGGTPRTPGKRDALVRKPEELKSLCVEHSREPRGYDPEGDSPEGEEYERG